MHRFRAPLSMCKEADVPSSAIAVVQTLRSLSDELDTAVSLESLAREVIEGARRTDGIRPRIFGRPTAVPDIQSAVREWHENDIYQSSPASDADLPRRLRHLARGIELASRIVALYTPDGKSAFGGLPDLAEADTLAPAIRRWHHTQAG